jgi:hypothetical protein
VDRPRRSPNPWVTLPNPACFASHSDESAPNEPTSSGPHRQRADKARQAARWSSLFQLSFCVTKKGLLECPFFDNNHIVGLHLIVEVSWQFFVLPAGSRALRCQRGGEDPTIAMACSTCQGRVNGTPMLVRLRFKPSSHAIWESDTPCSLMYWSARLCRN